MEVIEGIQFFPEIESILMMDSSSDFRLDYDMDPITVGSYKIAPWGCDNLLPNHLLANISKNDIVSTNLRFNRDLCFGLGPKLIKVLARNKKGEISEYEEVNATIISRNLGYWYNTVIIDKGSKDGIKKDMAVTTAEALIGKVIKVSRNNSTIKLLTSSDINNKVSVQIKVDNNYIYGILTSFNEKEGSYIIEGISDTKNIKIGNLVSTTGMGNIFPSGILIGEVIEIEKDNFDLEAIIKVKPSFNIDNFNYVKVLRKKQ